VIIDDAVRADERALARQWVQEIPGFTLEFLSGGHNAALLTRRMRSSDAQLPVNG
jgi:hypothetical protein